MNRVPAFLALGLTGLIGLPPAMAQSAAGHAGHQHHPAADAGSSADTASTVAGEVRKVDKAAGKLTLRHGEIPKFDMPPMTMVFGVKDPAWLARFKVGDKVRFEVERGPAGFVVTAIESVQGP